jgi:hypothetical protein
VKVPVVLMDPLMVVPVVVMVILLMAILMVVLMVEVEEPMMMTTQVKVVLELMVLQELFGVQVDLIHQLIREMYKRLI